MDPSSSRIDLSKMLTSYERQIHGETKATKNIDTNIILKILVNKFEEINNKSLRNEDAEAIVTFSERLSKNHPQDKVVQLATYLAKQIVLSHLPVPENLQTTINAFKDDAAIRALSDTEKKQVASVVYDNLMMMGTKEYPLEDSKLIQFTKVLAACWNVMDLNSQALISIRLLELISASDNHVYAGLAQPLIDKAFPNMSIYNSLDSHQKTKLATFIYERLMKMGTKEVPINYSVLRELTKLFTVLWRDESIRNLQEPIAKKLSELLSNAEINKVATEFANLAIVLIKDVESKQVPNDIANHPAYHGKALKTGIDFLQTMMVQSGKRIIILQDFAMKYCEDHLQPRHFLLRNSSTVPSTDFNGKHTFAVTFSYKEDSDDVSHIRLVREQTADGKVVWRWGQTNYNSLENFIERNLTSKHIAPCRPPPENNVIMYVKNKYKPMLSND